METTGTLEQRLRLGATPRRGTAILLGIVVTILWASSVVLIKIGLGDETLDPIGFAGVRFTLAAVMLLPLALPRLRTLLATRPEPRSFLGLLVYGLLMFGVAQIAVHVALGTVSASTIGLMIGLTPVATALFSMRGRHERATSIQLVGIAVLVVGVTVFFGLQPPEAGMLPSVLLAATIPLVVGAASVMGRRLALHVDRYGGPLGFTSITMLAGGMMTVVVALVVEGMPDFSLRAWLLIIWMAAINTALAYTLWTQVLRALRAVEASVLGDLIVVMTAFLAWIVLGEALSLLEMAGLTVALVGVVIVQVAPIYRARSLRYPRTPTSQTPQ